MTVYTVKFGKMLDSAMIVYYINQAIEAAGLSCQVKRSIRGGCTHGSTAIDMHGGYYDFDDLEIFTVQPETSDTTHFDDCVFYESIVLACSTANDAILAMIVDALERSLHKEPRRRQSGDLVPA